MMMNVLSLTLKQQVGFLQFMRVKVVAAKLQIIQYLRAKKKDIFPANLIAPALKVFDI